MTGDLNITLQERPCRRSPEGICVLGSCQGYFRTIRTSVFSPGAWFAAGDRRVRSPPRCWVSRRSFRAPEPHATPYSGPAEQYPSEGCPSLGPVKLVMAHFLRGPWFARDTTNLLRRPPRIEGRLIRGEVSFTWGLGCAFTGSGGWVFRVP